MFDKLQQLTVRHMNRVDSGDIVSSFSNDVFVVENAIVRAIRHLLKRLRSSARVLSPSRLIGAWHWRPP